MSTKKTVSFETKSTIIPAAKYHKERSKDELKTSWYSRKDLLESCSEAKRIVAIINSVDGDMDAIDHSQICVVGLEKYHGKKDKEKYRKLLIRSVLIRQEMNRGLGVGHDGNCLCQISEMISTSFKEFALWQAAMHSFHAYGTPSSSDTVLPRPLKDQNFGQTGNKRQRLIHAPGSCPLSPGSCNLSPKHQQSPPCKHESTEAVNTEIRQILTDYCSR